MPPPSNAISRSPRRIPGADSMVVVNGFHVAWHVPTPRRAPTPSSGTIPGNERANKLATIGGGSQPFIPLALRGNFLSNYVQNMDSWRKAQAPTQEYRGRQWLAIRCKRKWFLPRICNKTNANFFLRAAKDSITAMARIAHCITNDAPTGEYRQRFFPGKPTHCATCGPDTLLLRKHILCHCPRHAPLAPSINDWQHSRNNGKLLFTFLPHHQSRSQGTVILWYISLSLKVSLLAYLTFMHF